MEELKAVRIEKVHYKIGKTIECLQFTLSDGSQSPKADRWFEPERTFVFPKQLRIRSISTSFDGWHLTSITFRDENGETIL